MPVEKTITVEVVNGPEGASLVIEDTRVAGPKPWGGSTLLHTFKVDVKRLKRLLADVEAE